MTDTDWTQALCGKAPELFFPPGYGRSYRPQIDEAKRACARCPLLADCLREALEQEDSKDGGSRFGVRGGLTPRERYRLHLQMNGFSLASA